MRIHIDYQPVDDCVQMEEEPFYGMCRKCNKCDRFTSGKAREIEDYAKGDKNDNS